MNRLSSYVVGGGWIKHEYGVLVAWYWQEEGQNTGHPPKLSHELALEWAWLSTARGRQPTAWVMERWEVKHKLSLCVSLSHMEGIELELHLFFTSALFWIEWSRPDGFTTSKNAPGTHWIENLGKYPIVSSVIQNSTANLYSYFRNIGNRNFILSLQIPRDQSFPF